MCVCLRIHWNNNSYTTLTLNENYINAEEIRVKLNSTLYAYLIFVFFLCRDAAGEEKLNVKFEPGELREAARTFEEGLYTLCTYNFLNMR